MAAVASSLDVGVGSFGVGDEGSSGCSSSRVDSKAPTLDRHEKQWWRSERRSGGGRGETHVVRRVGDEGLYVQLHLPSLPILLHSYGGP